MTTSAMMQRAVIPSRPSKTCGLLPPPPPPKKKKKMDTQKKVTPTPPKKKRIPLLVELTYHPPPPLYFSRPFRVSVNATRFRQPFPQGSRVRHVPLGVQVVTLMQAWVASDRWFGKPKGEGEILHGLKSTQLNSRRYIKMNLWVCTYFFEKRRLVFV